MASGSGASGAPAFGSGGGGGSSTLTTQNLNQIVTDYLLKRGFTRTEATFRQEQSVLDASGRPVMTKPEGLKKYQPAFKLLKNWIDGNLDIYKFELNRLLWPIFVYSFLEMVSRGYVDDAKAYFESLRSLFEPVHSDDLKTFSLITLAQHAKENPTARAYLENKYRIPMNKQASASMFNYLEREWDKGGSAIIFILQTYCTIDATARGPIDPYSFEAIYRRGHNLDPDDADQQEGIPGVFTGVHNKDALDNSTPLKLGPLPMEPELREDVRAELEEEDRRNPPTAGRPTLVEEFDRKIKREESADGPTRNEIPLPPSRARDVVMEMQKVRENRDRFKIEGRTGGVGVGVSVCMFTFHNTLGSVTCMDFSKDHKLVAVGTSDSYIRVWSMDGKPLTSKMQGEKDLKVNNRKLIGHSGPVFDICFSDAITNMDRNIFSDESDQDKVDTSSRLLLSCSADGHVRLWSLEVWSCLCIYKGHDGPVLRLQWGPHGHYFATGGWDKTVRVWMQDKASAQRLMVGHDTSISAIAWHPNGAYVFSASDETDKTIRMWSVVTGRCVRIFTGHTDYISALEVAPNGRLLASADHGGNIFFWDIDKGTRIKRSRGHGKGGIFSLSFSVESTVLVSGGQDGTVRVWDVELPAQDAGLLGKGAIGAAGGGQLAAPQDGAGAAAAASAVGNATSGANINVETGAATGTSAQGAAGAAAAAGGAGASGASGTAAQGAAAGLPGAGTGKKKGKEVMITPDQISAFPTKKTPVMKVQFTRMNLVVAGGCYDPDR